ncbi:hypothetical protein BCR36DRAFT_365811 [Piromyces finnis]|uniref:Uncharacterized protein n=1 Tax=Piromyces finnis TaxID=1754191 RepID=A0A1Y1VQ12_9FUNG|nr:hypothetical protein BCR36DRAFT_365811 [Piromyces finnis]|eukprot:ORX61232.1 hypothetical protein BCR36DRAFT_365811 [Piromyces finnis]
MIFLFRNKIILYICYTIVSALNTFIENGQRPELFELTDNEIVTFKITIPDEEFTLLKEKANVQGLTPPISNFTLEMELGKQSYRVYFEEMLNQNFTNYFQILIGKKDLFRSSQLKFRSDLTEPTFLRSKLTSDNEIEIGNDVEIETENDSGT